jgi:hypothetical protein
MPTKRLSKCLRLAVLAMTTCQGIAEVPAMRDAVTEEQLVLAHRIAAQKDPMKALPVSKLEDPAVLNPPQDLLSQSDFLCLGDVATLVPKRAILQVPEAYASRLKIPPGAHIVGWADFYAANRGWITTIEITRVQAEGKEPIAEATRQMMNKCSNVIVATYQGGPISLLPAKAPPPAKSPTVEKPSDNKTP